jgi:hypothetical protein
MHLDDVVPSASNPYGITSIAYDCDDGTLWVSAIDESSYTTQNGVIYHIDIKSKTILQRVDGVDALSMYIVTSSSGKFLLIGSARDAGLYAYPIQHGKLYAKASKLYELPSDTERIRKIKLKKDNVLELQCIPFSYTLITQTDTQDRTYYKILWNSIKKTWKNY